MSGSRARQRAVALLVVVGMLGSMLLAGLVSWIASDSPDGLDRVAADAGFGDRAGQSAAAGSPLADYQAAFVTDERAGVTVAGLAGVLITAVLAFGLFWLLRAGRRRAGEAEPTGQER